MTIAIIGCVCGLISAFVAIGTLIYKYARVVSMVEENTKDIKELRIYSKEYQSIIQKTLDEIKNGIAVLNTNLAILTSRLDYMEKEKK